MSEVLLFSLSLALGIAVPATIVRYDLARLRGEPLARAWPDASLWSAVVMFGPLCVPLHFIRTRRSWAGVGLGVFWLVCAVGSIFLLLKGLAAIFGVTDP